MTVNKPHFSISITDEAKRILERYMKQENRNQSNMVDEMIKAYAKLHDHHY